MQSTFSMNFVWLVLALLILEGWTTESAMEWRLKYVHCQSIALTPNSPFLVPLTLTLGW